MRCGNCNNKVEKGYLFCPYCSKKIKSSVNEPGMINAGSNNINIGLGNNSTQEIYIEQLNVSKQHKEPIVEYSDRLERVVLGGVEGFKRKYEICGILSAVSAVVTISDYFLTKSDLGGLFLMATLGLSAYALDSREKHKALKDKGTVYRDNRPILTVENDGKVYKISKFGICSICGGRVFINYDDKFKRKLGKCENNKDHLFTYDHTIDAGVPYVTFDFFHTN